MRRKRIFGNAAAALASVAFGATIAHADVLIAGEPKAIHLEVRDASLREVLDLMQAKFNLRYRSADALDGTLNGTFDGPLPRVAARILDGYDFAMKVSSDGIDVLVLQQNPRSPVVASLQPPAKVARPHPMTAQEANRRARGLAERD
jgi:hypothetical protein